MTSEPKEPTDAWVEKHGAEYAYAYDKGAGLMRVLGLSGYPSAALVDPAGTVVWTGHPGSLKKETIETHVRGALPTPVHEWPKVASSVKRAVLKDRIGAAVKEAGRRSQKDPFLAELHGQLQEVAKARVAALRARLEAGDYLAVKEGAKRLKKSLSGLPEADGVQAITKDLSAIKGHQRIAKAQASVRKLAAEQPRRKKDCEEVIARLERIREKHAGDAAGREAEVQAQRFREMMARMRF